MHFFTPLTAGLPLADQNAFNDGCSKYWWSNLIYMNNFVTTIDDGCITWTWLDIKSATQMLDCETERLAILKCFVSLTDPLNRYLAIDFQIYCLLPLFVLLHRRVHRLFSFATLGFFLAVSIVITGVLVSRGHFRFDFPPPADATPPVGDYAMQIYTKPYTRWGPSMIGIALAFLLVDNPPSRRMNVTLNWILSTLSYTTWFVLVFVLNWSTNKKDPYHWSDDAENAVFCLGRPLWTLSTAFITYTSVTGQGGVVGWVLSRKVWAPLAKLTYQVDF
jgi:hypothetical protein